MRRPIAIHLSKVSNPGFTLCTTKGSKVTNDPPRVTCKRCLRLIAVISTMPSKEDVPQELNYQVFLLKNGPNRINVIKVIRHHTSLGLKESKELSDMAYNYETLLLAGAERERALKFVNELTFVGAIVRLDNSTGGSEFFYPRDNTNPKSSVQTSLETAYWEMLRLFLPEELTSKYSTMNECLDQFDDDIQSGHRFFPYQQAPRISDIRRWVEAGGIE